MMTVVCIAGVIIGAGVIEKRFMAQGDASAARTTKQFGRWFILGSGTYVVWEWVSAALTLIM